MFHDMFYTCGSTRTELRVRVRGLWNDTNVAAHMAFLTWMCPYRCTESQWTTTTMERGHRG